MRQTLILLLRHLLVWKQTFWLYALYFTFQPFILLYGMEKAFNSQDVLAYMTPGFMVYTVAAACLMGAAYNLYEHIIEGQAESWLGANVSIPQILWAYILLQCIRSVVSATSLLVCALILVPNLSIHNLLAVTLVLVVLAAATSLWGFVMAAKAKSINQIYLSDTIIYAVFVFSGVFVETSMFPVPVQWAMWALPFWHAVELARPLFLGEPLVAEHAWVNAGVLTAYLTGGYVLAITSLKARLIT